MDTKKLLRSTRTARQLTSLPTRPDKDLIFLKDLPETGERILLDACVYIDQMQGRLSADLQSRIAMRTSFHSSLAVSELCFTFGRLDPGDPRSQGVWDTFEDLIGEIPDHRILTPSAATEMRGSVLAGAMTRLLNYSDAQRRKALIDAILAAQASAEQILFVTRNISDFDRLSQLDPGLRVAFYRT